MFRFFIALILLSFSIHAHAGKIEGSVYGIGNWYGAAYVNDHTGQFGYCVITASYQSGDALHISVNRDATVSLAVSNPRFGLAKGTTIPVNLYIDNRPPIQGNANAISSSMAMLHLYDYNRTLDALKKGRMLIVQWQGGEARYRLDGTYRALSATENCAVRYLDYYTSARAPVIPPETVPKTADQVDPSFLYQIATQMITAADIKDSQYMNEQNTTELFGDNAVAWTSDVADLLGAAILTVREEDIDLRHSDGNDISFLTGGCQSDVATTSRDLLLGDTPAREIRTVCVGGSESRLTKMFIGDHMLYSVLVFGNNPQAAPTTTRKKISEDVATRAASYVKTIKQN